jgi:hypothetical protein
MNNISALNVTSYLRGGEHIDGLHPGITYSIIVIMLVGGALCVCCGKN